MLGPVAKPEPPLDVDMRLQRARFYSDLRYVSAATHRYIKHAQRRELPVDSWG
jgi:hypothetical protein